MKQRIMVWRLAAFGALLSGGRLPFRLSGALESSEAEGPTSQLEATKAPRQGRILGFRKSREKKGQLRACGLMPGLGLGCRVQGQPYLEMQFYGAEASGYHCCCFWSL